jgi:superoxide reductase
MAKKLQVFKCDSCGSIVESLHESGCDPACCGKPMRLLAENATDGAKEKHVPVLERRPGGILVKVGSVAHPMEAEHYIEWIELSIPAAADGGCAASYRAFLKPGDKSEAFFPVESDKAQAREYCNKHGLWKN